MSHPFRFSAIALFLTATLAAQKALVIKPDQIPSPPASMNVLRLDEQKPPTQFVMETLRKHDPKFEELTPISKMEEIAGKGGRIPSEIVGKLRNGQLEAYVDLRSGDAEIFPSLLEQKPIPEEQAREIMERAENRVREIFAQANLLPKDATEITFEKPRPLYGETAERAESDTNVKTGTRGLYLTYVPVRRSVDHYFVYGAGSRALIALGNDGSVQGFVRRWKVASPGSEVRETRSKDQIVSAIQAQLQPLAKSAEVELLGVEIAYYDGNGKYLQPAYRFTARIREYTKEPAYTDKNKQIADDFIEGYVAIGKEMEPLPSLLAPVGGASPDMPKQKEYKEPAPGDPTVGRYVVRNDDPGWVASANGFWNGLNFFFGGSLFTNSQYYWAEPWEYTTSEASFINTVNVALSESHGDWWLITTLKNCCDVVDLTTIPASRGYGPANGGHLAYWVLHSCEVVPSASDAPCATDARPWWTPWFNIFRGMHTTVGYRTIMYINDGTTTPFAMSLRLGAPVVSAWFNATNSAPDYHGTPKSPDHCGRNVPMGRPSTVSACGRQNDSVFDLTPLPAANCLTNFWQPN